MNNYIINNINLINEYENLYTNGIDIDKIIKLYEKNCFTKSSFENGRFRIFIDSCLLLLNKEKLNNYKKNEYTFSDFIKIVGSDPDLQTYFQFIKKSSMYKKIKMPCIFYSLQRENLSAWDQVSTIRNALAHMQYGHFMSKENGFVICYAIFNKDKGIKKDQGIVFEPIFHEFVKRFFSNYCFGMPFKTCFFMKYSVKSRKKTFRYKFYKVFASKNTGEKYNGYAKNAVSELIVKMDEGIDVVDYLCKHEKDFVIEESYVKDKINLKFYNKYINRYKKKRNINYYQELRTFLDFETELSNFLIHIGQLNNVVYNDNIVKSEKISQKKVEQVKIQCIEQLNELREDENASIAFEIGFQYLKLMNLVLRVEDDDYCKINYGEVNITGFDIDEKSFMDYVNANNIFQNARQIYVLERMRNALMHGNIECALVKCGEVQLRFIDLYNNRRDTISILLPDLKVFLNQKCLYNGIPRETKCLKMNFNKEKLKG